MAERKLLVEIVGDDRQLSRTFDRASRNSKSFGKDIERAGRGAAVATVGFRGLGRSIAFASGAFLGGAGFVAGAKAVVSAASNLNEQINKSQVVFGASAAEIGSWSKTTAGALGLSQRAALEAAGGFGQLLETAGLTEPVAAKFSKRLVGLAADMASFNNIDPAEALLKLKSGLAGEAEPLRTVGVLLSEARVKQEAYSSGIAKAGSTLTEGQKVQARYNLILKDTAKQQGDFARTSDSFANAQRVVKANFENLAAQIGSAVLPSIARATTAFGGFLTKLTEAKGFHAKLNVILDAGKNLLEQGIKVAEQIRENVGAALEQIDWRNVGESISRGLVRALQAIADFVRSVDWSQVGKSIVSGIAEFLKGVDWVGLFKSIVKLWVAALKALGNLLIGAGKEIFRNILEGIKQGAHIALLFIEKWALEALAKVLGVFGFLGRFNPFRGTEEKVKASLARVQADIDNLHGKNVEITVTRNDLVPGAAEHGRGVGGSTVTPPTKPPPVVVPVVTHPTATELAAKAKKEFERAMGKLEIKFDIAQRTKSLQDDLAILKEQEKVIAARLKVTKNDLDLQKQLVSVQNQELDIQKQINENQKTALQTKQFKALGLTPEGDKPTPGSGSLLKRAQSLENQIKGTTLDTSKTRGQLQRIVSFLKHNFKTAGKDVRDAILGMLNDISNALKGKSTGSVQTKFVKRGIEQMLDGLGLSPEQIKELRQRFAQSGPGGTVPGTGVSAFGFAVQPAGSSSRFLERESQVSWHIYIDGEEVEARVTRRQQKKRGRQAPSRRGTSPGMHR